MTVKRTRSNSNETHELEAPSSAVKSSPNQTAVQLQSKRMISSSSSSPVQESSGVTNKSKLGNFLEKCQYCQKKIPDGVEVFMYKDFSAFCSSGCRDIQISLDKLAERQPTTTSNERVNIAYQQDMKDVNNHAGSCGVDC
ncbi:hypothetical protein M9H77_01462 [Catharanthus roseus]|uniref:Uncharacterized protein n=1 Tax=Catharanthus roseus TaxID=4058 RepID=A0ACC0C5R7_CATRO|nr:hypothetical protein M9H77_01462 [Catharanthus roseus]